MAIAPATPFASAALDAWFTDPVMYQDRVDRLLHELRPYLNAPDREVRDRAFRLLATAAQAARDNWLLHVPRESTAAPPVGEPDMSRARAAALVARGIAEQLYFASGAFDERLGTVQQTADQSRLNTFARAALPVLQACGQVTEPQVTQPVVETLVYLASVYQREALLSIAAVIPARGAYVTDPQAAETVMPYLRLLLAERRELVLFDGEGIGAFRHLLQAFAAAGNPNALELAYTFADVFR
jgi:hypothetical protein